MTDREKITPIQWANTFFFFSFHAFFLDFAGSNLFFFHLRLASFSFFFFHAFFFFFFSSLGVELSFFCFFPLFWRHHILFFLFLASFSCFFFLEVLCFLSLLPLLEQAIRNRFLCFLIVSLIHVDPVCNHCHEWHVLAPPAPNMFVT